MRRKFKQWWLTIPPISTKWTTTSYLRFCTGYLLFVLLLLFVHLYTWISVFRIWWSSVGHSRVLFVYFCITIWDQFIKIGRAEIPLTGLTPPYVCACPKPGLGFSKCHLSWSYFVHLFEIRGSCSVKVNEKKKKNKQ
jgi:hypothetical protein